jgi:hypothetical protein
VTLLEIAQLAGDTAFKAKVKSAMAVEAMALVSQPMDPSVDSEHAYRRRQRVGLEVIRNPDGPHNAMTWMVAATEGITSAATDVAILAAVRGVLTTLTKDA